MTSSLATTAGAGAARLATILFAGLLSACVGDKDPVEPSGDSGRPQLEDADGDGYGAEVDCDDTSSAISPGAAEICNGLDDDCDGLTDEAGVEDGTRWYPDADADGFGDGPSGVLLCEQPEGWVADATDCDDGNASVSPDADELCDTLDNDCDGEIDEAGARDGLPAHEDADGDGYGDAPTTVVCAYEDGYVANGSDCDDGDAASYPGATERCDDADNDCDGEIDNDATDGTTYFEDGDGDNYGVSTSTIEACDRPTGYASRAGDCDDDNRNTYPGASERCDDEDNDCDGDTDEDAIDSNHYYTDLDGDGYGTDDTEVVTCDDMAGDDIATEGGDCDDDDTAVNPGVDETWYDGIDQDCDGKSDYDADGDGYVLASLEDEDAPTIDPGTGEIVDDGSRTLGGDCDDEDRRVSPAQIERCNDIDDNCDGEVDNDARDATIWYVDLDDDGFGAESSAEALCDAPDYEGTRVGGDCDDADATINPGAEEACGDDDGVDNDCDSVVDEVCYSGDLNYLQVAGTDPDDYECDLWWTTQWVETGSMCPDCEYGFNTELSYEPDISDNRGRCVDERDADFTWLLSLDLGYDGGPEARVWYGYRIDYGYYYDDDVDYDVGDPGYAEPPYATYTYWQPLFYATFDEATGALTFEYGYFYAYDYGRDTYYYGSQIYGTADLDGLGG